MLVWFCFFALFQFPWIDSSSTFTSSNPLAFKQHLSSKELRSHGTPFSTSRPLGKYDGIDKSGVHYYDTGSYEDGYKFSDLIDNPYSTITTQYEQIIPSTIPTRIAPAKFNPGGISGAPVTFESEVIRKPNFVVQPQIETIQKPEFVVQDNVIGVIQKPDFFIQEFQEVVPRPEFLIKEEVVGTVAKPTFVVKEQVNVIQKPEFLIQDDVEVIMKPEFLIEEVNEVVTKPTFLIEENVVPIQKPTFAIQSTQEIIQKPDIVISPVPVTVQKPEYQIEENIIPVQKPSFLIKETEETVIKPQFVITEEVVSVPRPNFLVEEELQVVQRPNFVVQDVVETVQRPEYNLQESTIVVQKPEFVIEEITEKIVKPTFVEQEFSETVISPRYVVQDQLVPVVKPQFVVTETTIPVVKPEFLVEEITEIVPRPSYLVENVPVVVEKPTYVLEETPLVVAKPNYVIEETIQTVPKPEYFIQEEVEVITKPEFIVQDGLVETIVKPKFVVISASNPTGEVFDAATHNGKAASSSSEVYKAAPAQLQGSSEKYSQNVPDYKFNSYPLGLLDLKESSAALSHFDVSDTPNYEQKISATQTKKEPVVILPSLKPKLIDGVEEFSRPVSANHVISHIYPTTSVNGYSGIEMSTVPSNSHEKLLSVPDNYYSLPATTIRPIHIFPTVETKTLDVVEIPSPQIVIPKHLESLPTVYSPSTGYKHSGLEIAEVTSLNPDVEVTTLPIPDRHQSFSYTHPVIRTESLESVPVTRPFSAKNIPTHYAKSPKEVIVQDSTVPVPSITSLQRTVIDFHGLKTIEELLGESMKVKKSAGTSEAEAMFETVNGFPDNQVYMKAGIPHPLFGYMYEDEVKKLLDMNKFEEVESEAIVDDSNEEESVLLDTN